MAEPTPSPSWGADDPAEGGAPGLVESRPRAVVQWPMVLVMLGVVGAMAITWTDHWRKGAFAFGFAVTVGGLLRLVLPTRVAGWLAVRRRWLDVTLLLVVGMALMAITLIVPPSPPPSRR